MKDSTNLDDQIIGFLSEKGASSRSRIAEGLNSAYTTIYDHLEILKKKGKVKKFKKHNLKRGRPKVLWDLSENVKTIPMHPYKIKIMELLEKYKALYTKQISESLDDDYTSYSDILNEMESEEKIQSFYYDGKKYWAQGNRPLIDVVPLKKRDKKVLNLINEKKYISSKDIGEHLHLSYSLSRLSAERLHHFGFINTSKIGRHRLWLTKLDMNDLEDLELYFRIRLEHLPEAQKTILLLLAKFYAYGKDLNKDQIASFLGMDKTLITSSLSLLRKKELITIDNERNYHTASKYYYRVRPKLIETEQLKTLELH